MTLIYEGQKRDNLDALIYGADEVGREEPVWRDVRGESGSGYTVLHGKDGRRLFFKHARMAGSMITTTDWASTLYPTAAA